MAGDVSVGGDLRVSGTATFGVLILPASTVLTANIAPVQVTAAKLTDTLATGYVPLPLTAFRLIASNDIPNSGAADGGVISQDTVPKLERVNDATDKKLRIAWAAAGVIEITQDFVYPPDLDDTQAVTIHLLAAMAGATDTPLIAVGFFEGVGDTNAGGNTGAITGTAVAEYTRTIAAGDVGVSPKAASVTLIPAAHGTDALYLLGCWVEYTRM